MIVLLDFGAQYTQLIAKRVRELNVYSKILPYDTKASVIRDLKDVKGIIFSGGPSSVYAKDALSIDKDILDLGIPILGICYGLQLLSFLHNAKVVLAEKKEYGYAHLNILKKSLLLTNVDQNSKVWMSHSDSVESLPEGFTLSASTENCKYTVLENDKSRMYGVQFHPEVYHSQQGFLILSNFILKICKANQNWTMKNFINEEIKKIKDIVKDKHVICGLSGGVDSSVTAALLHKAIGNQLTCVFVDTGLLRLDEAKKVIHLFKDDLHYNLKVVNDEKRFLSALKDVVEPEEKRKIIGKEFIESFYNAAKSIKDVSFLAQGTLYPDVIESESAKNKGPSSTIKSHHNVGGLPKDLKWALIEPLRELFKDEVRALGLELGLPKEQIYRQPFPGPGLGVRCIGAITKKRLDTLRQADAILDEEVRKANLDGEIWQYLVDLLPVKSVGVQGDYRTYKEVCSIRAVNSIDGMTADWYRFDYDVLQKISSRICNEVDGINRVLYDVSSKPPATIEWE